MSKPAAVKDVFVCEYVTQSRGGPSNMTSEIVLRVDGTAEAGSYFEGCCGYVGGNFEWKEDEKKKEILVFTAKENDSQITMTDSDTLVMKASGARSARIYKKRSEAKGI